MKNIVISIKEVIELNQQLEEKGIYYKIHLHDACGAQSFSIESISEDILSEDYERCKENLNTYFKEKGLSVIFTQNGYDFFVK